MFTVQNSASCQVVNILVVGATLFILGSSLPEMSLQEQNEISLNSSYESRGRFRRQGNTLYIEIIGIVDHLNYYQYYKIYGDSAREEILKFYNFVFHEVNLMYSKYFDLQIKLKDLLILTNQIQLGDMLYVIIGGSLIDLALLQSSLQKVIYKEHKEDILHNSDYVVLFTGGTLARQINGQIYEATGSTFRGNMCLKNGYSFAILEDKLGTTRVTIIGSVIRFLAFSLNAQTDKGECVGGYHMAEYVDTFHPNYFSFSTCTLQDIYRFLKLKLTSTHGRQCLESQQGVVEFPDPFAKVLGHYIDIDHQCVTMFGITSRFCGQNTSSYCSNFKCSQPSLGTCKKVLPYTGTPCGTNKACVEGQCLNFNGPIPHQCYRDPEKFFMPGKDCSQLDYEGHYCYDPQVRIKCCKSCKRLYKSIKGCEYGDKVDWCNKVACEQKTYIGVNITEACCAKCAANRRKLYQFNSASCTRDILGIVKNGLDCYSSTVKVKGFCYSEYNRCYCCASCMKLYKNYSGCEYGDKGACTKTDCKEINNNINLSKRCCETCRDEIDVCSGGTNTNLQPELCTKPSICQTNKGACCRYCYYQASTNYSPRCLIDEWLQFQILSAWFTLNVASTWLYF